MGFSSTRAEAATPAVTPQFTGLQIQTSSSALPIPVLYGTNRLAPNILWSGNFQAHAQYSEQQQPNSGKGGGGSSTQTTVSGYYYTTAILFALCEGVVANLGAAYRNQHVYASSDYFTLMPGTTPQAPWSYLAASFPDQALAYQGTALAGCSIFGLGTSASIGSLSFEVLGPLSGSAGFNAYDADPAKIVADFLTNPQLGIAFPPASIDAASLYGVSGDGSYQTWCKAAGLALSPCLVDQEAANAVLTRWLRLTNATAVWSGGRLKIVSYGDAVLTNAGVTFQPALAPVADLTDDDFLHEDDADPVRITRADPYAAPNVQSLEILDRANQYSATPIEARDQNAIEQTGLRTAATLTAHEICDTGVAAVAAQLILQRGLYVRNAYSFRLSWEHCLLEPMDIVTLTDVNLGLSRTPVRIVEIEEDGEGLLAVLAEECPGSVGTAAAYTVAGAAGRTIDRGTTPAPVNPPVIVEPPSDLTGGTAQLLVGLSGGRAGVADPNWGGAAIHVSTDNATYSQVGTATGASRQGVLTAAIGVPPGAPADTLSVSFAQSGASLTVTANTPRLVVDGEFMSFASATLTAPYTYTLGGLKRALFGGRGLAHAAGAQVLLLDPSTFAYTLPAGAIGKPLWLKFASFNTFGAAPQDLVTCTAYPVTPAGSGLFGPVSQAIATGTSLDAGLGSQAVTETDDDGIASDPYTVLLDMGLASEAATALPLQSGGTGATTPAQARANMGAAAAGANADIVSLTNLSGLAIGAAVDTVTNKLLVKSASTLLDNVGAGVQQIANKAGATDSATTVYQTGYSGRAYAGLLGSDRYRISVSAAGASFVQALDIDPATGHVGLNGYTADAGNALGVKGTAFLFTAETDSCRFTVNKAAAGNDASVSFQTGFSARALAGLLGSDDWQLKVSPDGGSFYQVLVADRMNGNAAFKALLGAASYAVAGLPTGFNGAVAFANNGRKMGEVVGAGTGVLVGFSNGQWRRFSDDAVVSA